MSVLAYAWGWRGLLPDEEAARFGFSADPLLRRSAARALGWGAAPGQVQRLLSALLTDPEPPVRRGALWSVCLLDPASGVSAARRQLESQEPDPFSARVLGLLGTSVSIGALQPLVLHEKVGPACIRALGDLGDPNVMEILIDLLDDVEERAEAAREAIVAILGFVPESEGAEDQGTVEAAAQGDSAAPGGESAVPPEEGGSDEEEAQEGTTDGGREPSGNADDVRKAWRAVEGHYQDFERALRGSPFPWTGIPAEEPMEAMWRNSLIGSRPDLAWLRNEVPDGFFDEVPVFEAVPGE